MEERIIKSFDGVELYMKKETAPDNKAIVVIVHGLCEHQGRYDYFAEKLHAAGYGTYRFDHRGHGRSQGDMPNYGSYHEILDDTNVIVDLAIAENPHIPVYLLGHSMVGLPCPCTVPSIPTRSCGALSPPVPLSAIPLACSPVLLTALIPTFPCPMSWAAVSALLPRWWTGTARILITGRPTPSA